MDLFSHPLASPDWERLPAAPVRLHTRALWVHRTAGAGAGADADEPRRRIIHARAAFADQPMALRALRVAPGAGYHKCASERQVDAARQVRVRVPEGDGWRVVADTTIRDPHAETRIPLELETTGVVAEIRRAEVDQWWPGWNLAVSGLRLDGEAPPWTAPRQDWLTVTGLDLTGLPAGVSAEHRAGEVRYRTPTLAVGFRLRTPALAFLGVDEDGLGRTDRNLLQLPRSMDIVRSGLYPAGVYPVLRDQLAEYLGQGPRLTSHTGARTIGFLASDFTGTVAVEGAIVRYEVDLPAHGQHYQLTFEVAPDQLVIHAVRTGRRDLRAWTSSAWQVAADNRVTPSCVLGVPLHRGETGLLGGGELLWHFPRHGCLRVKSDGDGLWRSDSVRGLDTNTLELKVGEQPTDDGDYLLPAGRYQAGVRIRPGAPGLARLRADAPAPVRRMVARHAMTALPFRADTNTYSNNGASMHCTTSLNDLSALSVRFGEVVAGLSATDMLRWSLERWLDGAPSYGSGRTSTGPHLLEDEYVHLAADTLLGLGRYLAGTGDLGWFDGYREQILAAVHQMRARDINGDGLVESTIRRGITGEHQWSTAWCDVLSFGYQDAWANATLYEALRTLAGFFADPRAGVGGLAVQLDTWADRLRQAYVPTFLNPATGWFGGWRSADGVLHDYAFPLVNGAAVATDLVDVPVGRSVLTALWTELDRVGYTDLRNGLPLNLHRIPEADIGGVVFGLPLGGYQQGGASHHRARVVVDALYRVGLTDWADQLLTSLAETIADDTAFGGCGSGVDWRMWDGTPSGYEGQLAEGFSVLASAIDRYGTGPAREATA